MKNSIYLRNDHRLHVQYKVFSFPCRRCDDAWWTELSKYLRPEKDN